jgi:glycosyltransferase involved in cell wall biosynthesis
VLYLARKQLMRIAFVVKGGLHPSGRDEIMPAWVALLDCLSRRHEVQAFVTRHLPKPATYRLRGITVHDLGQPAQGTRFGRWSEWRALSVALAASGPFDVLHGFWADPGWLAVLAGRRFSVPSVVTFNSGEFTAIYDITYGWQRTVRGRALVRSTGRLATRVHVATEHMERLAAAHGVPAIKIPIGVDLAHLRPPETPSAGPPWRLLQIASLNAVKDQATVLDAVARVARTRDVCLDLVGEDTLHGALQRRASELGLGERVTFHGFRPFDELLPFYQRAHLYVQSSRHEAAGAAVLEAAACGLPIVGTRVGYVADWSGHASVAVPTEDAGALAKAIVETLDDQERRARLGAHARAFAETHDVEWTARELERLYLALASGSDSEHTQR